MRSKLATKAASYFCGGVCSGGWLCILGHRYQWSVRPRLCAWDVCERSVLICKLYSSRIWCPSSGNRSILFRDVLPYDQFNSHVVRANTEIELLVSSMPNVHFWHHRRFWHPQTPIWDLSGPYPGVHLNNEGNRKYLRSIRDAIIRISRW